jgi:hypothetical protein
VRGKFVTELLPRVCGVSNLEHYAPLRLKE